MAEWNSSDLSVLPEQSQEDALHADRLLAVEERPFKRVTEKILSKKSTVRSSLTYIPSPPPEGSSEGEEHDAFVAQRFRHDVLVDFANLESSLIRIQLILSSNQRERERYAAEKAKILETAQAVRDNTVELRTQLVEVQRILEQRKGYDEQAAKILDDKKLRSREESKANIEQLEKEIEDLKQESAGFEFSWMSRREQFDHIVQECDAMVRSIRGIKDEPEAEPEKDEDMEGVDDGAEEGEDGLKAGNSRFNSPGPDSRSPRPDIGDSTPMLDTDDGGDTTPQPVNKFLEIDDASRSNSRLPSPLVQPAQTQVDVPMEYTNMVDEITMEQTGRQEKTTDNKGADVDVIAPSHVSTTTTDVVMDEN